MPRQYQQTVLLVGIVLALVMRGIFIAVGAALIEQFSWVFYLFGAFLIYTAVKLATQGEPDEDDFKENRLLVRSDPSAADSPRSTTAPSCTHRVDGKRVFTPMLMVIIALGTTDLLFALDSIPAIFGLTKEPYIVFAANVFALMGLRQLYFLIGGLLERLVYLVHRPVRRARVHRRQARAGGAARQQAAVHQRRRARRGGAGDPHLGVPGVIIGILTVTTVASLVTVSRRPTV